MGEAQRLAPETRGMEEVAGVDRPKEIFARDRHTLRIRPRGRQNLSRGLPVVSVRDLAGVESIATEERFRWPSAGRRRAVSTHRRRATNSSARRSTDWSAPRAL